MRRHILANQEILDLLVKGYDKRQVDALNCGLMLRECIKIEQLAKIVLHDEAMFNAFYGYVQVSTFDIAADAFSTFKDLLTKHKIMCADFLDKSYDQVRWPWCYLGLVGVVWVQDCPMVS